MIPLFPKFPVCLDPEKTANHFPSLIPRWQESVCAEFLIKKRQKKKKHKKNTNRLELFVKGLFWVSIENLLSF